LQEKRQTKEQQSQAVMAIKMYYEVVKENSPSDKEPTISPALPQKHDYSNEKKHFYIREHIFLPIHDEKGITPPVHGSIPSPCVQGSSHALTMPGKENREPGYETSWKSEYSRLTDEIRIRHYSIKTLQT
jgi:hypothetical protein